MDRSVNLHRRRRALGGLAALWLQIAASAGAEVWTDGSLGPAVHLDASGGEYQITQDLGHSDGGGNLFHSFDRFSVERGLTATFSASEPIERVIARVTGGSLSAIDGTLRTAGGAVGADLFLLNPSGITFGRNAKLDLKGSFHVSTADRLRFESGPDFDATSSAPDPALSIAAPSAFGFLREAPALILFSQASGLTLPAGETFSAIGGPVVLTGNNNSLPGIQIFSGRIQLAAVDHPSDVPLDLASFGGAALAAAVADDQISDVTFSRGFNLDVNGLAPPAGSLNPPGPAGQVVIRGGSLTVDGSRISAIHRSAQDATAPAIDIDMVHGVELSSSGPFSSILTSQASIGAGRAADIVIRAGLVKVRDAGTLLQTRTLGAGAGAGLYITAGSIEISGGGSVLTYASGSGVGGKVALEATEGVRVFGGGVVNSSTAGAGEGGQIGIAAPVLDVTDGGQIGSEARAGAIGGDIVIDADRVFVSNETDREIPASIATIAVAGGAGGALTLAARDIEIVEGGSVATRTDAAGSGGKLGVIAAERVRLEGVDVAGRRAALTASTQPGSTGAGGSLSLASGVVEVINGGQISTTTQGSGDAGSLSIDAAERVSVRGGANGSSFISSDSRIVLGVSELPGGSGELEVRTGLLELRDGGRISASTDGNHDAGRIHIFANQVVVSGVDPKFKENPSAIQSRSNGVGLLGSGKAGGIEIEATGDVTLADRGELSSSTADTGDAGTTVVRAGGRIVLERDAKILALAEGSSTGKAGSITLDAGAGIELTQGSSIQAASLGFGPAGDVTIDAGPRLELRDSAIETQATSGSGGHITIHAQEIVWLRNSSLTTSVANGAGGGGDISIDPQFVVLDQSQIVAQAVEGEGGHIKITAGTFFKTPDSIVDASSTLGIDGTVSIVAPDTDVTSGITTLPSVFLDATALMRNACSAAFAQGGSFVVSTRAGLPMSPDAPLAAFAGAATAASIAHATPSSAAAARVALAGDYRVRSCARAQEEVL